MSLSAINLTSLILLFVLFEFVCSLNKFDLRQRSLFALKLSNAKNKNDYSKQEEENVLI